MQRLFRRIGCLMCWIQVCCSERLLVPMSINTVQYFNPNFIFCRTLRIAAFRIAGLRDMVQRVD